MTDPRIVRANTLVDLATTARLRGDNETANTYLSEAAHWYHDAGEFGEAQACKMLIVTE